LWLPGSQHPVLHVEPAQQVSPASPQTGGASTGASFTPVSDASDAASLPPLLESPAPSWPCVPSEAGPSFVVASWTPLLLPLASPLADSGIVPSVCGAPPSPFSKTSKLFEHAAKASPQSATTTAKRVAFTGTLGARRSLA
jgi:hypothetical protein